MDYASLQKKQDETPLTFYERLCHHARSHLAPAGATANGITNAVKDSMSISILNLIALDWVRALGLLEAVSTEFRHELKSGMQLSALVPRIAHQVETLRRRCGQSPIQQVSTVSTGYSAAEQQTDQHMDGQVDVMYI